MRLAIVAWGFVLMMLVSGAASAADVNGKWKSEFKTPNGQTRESVFEFKADGNKLVGTVSGGGGQAEISDGQIDGDTISFAVVREIGGNEMKFQYKGKVGADEIQLKVQMGERSFDMVAKKI